MNDIDVSENELAVLQLLGQSGEFLDERIVDLVRVQPWATELDDWAIRVQTRDHLNALQGRGWLEQRNIHLPLPSTFYNELGKKLVALTDAGRAAFQQHFGAAPVDGLAAFIAKYKTVEDGLLIRLAHQLIDEWNGRPDRHWDVTALDAAEADADALARIAYPPSAEYDQPDLILHMTPVRGGEPVLAVVKVDCGLYRRFDLPTRWDRSIHMVYCVVPDLKNCRTLFREWVNQINLLKQRGEPAHDVNATFYTLDVLREIGPLSARQLLNSSLRDRFQPGSRPLFWCQKTPKSQCA